MSHRMEGTVDIREGAQKAPAYLAINPMGKVPALRDRRDHFVTETAAICLFLADRYGYGTLAPRTDDVARGPFARWMVFSTATLEPAMIVQHPKEGAGAPRWAGARSTM